jgi:putative peptidoglycan lipid II flippase
VLVTQTMAVILMQFLGHAGLTLATSLGACFNASLLFVFLRRYGYYHPTAGWVAFLSKLTIALGVLAVVLYWLSGPADAWLRYTLWERAARLSGVIAAGGLAYFAALYLLGFRLADFNRREAAGTTTL